VLRPIIEVRPEEIVIPKLIFGDVYEDEFDTTTFRKESARPVKALLENKNWKKKMEEYLRSSRLVMYNNGGRIKYANNGNI
jgi:hypothetical protein